LGCLLKLRAFAATIAAFKANKMIHGILFLHAFSTHKWIVYF